MSVDVRAGTGSLPLPTEVDEVDLVPVRTYWQLVRQRFLRHRLAVIAVVVLAILIAMSIVVPLATGVHALSAGAIGVTCLAVMCRATRGHTGRPLIADKATVSIFVAINLAALLRVAAPFAGAFMPGLLVLAALGWSLAYGGYAIAYWAMLTQARK